DISIVNFSVLWLRCVPGRTHSGQCRFGQKGSDDGLNFLGISVIPKIYAEQQLITVGPAVKLILFTSTGIHCHSHIIIVEPQKMRTHEAGSGDSEHCAECV